MKQHRLNHSASGFTLTEVLVSIAVLGILGSVFFEVLQSGLVLFAKNTAVNITHEESRQGVARLTRDIHASVSVPEMRNVSVDATTGAVSLPTPDPSPTPIKTGSGASATFTSPIFAAVSFQNISAGPNYIWQDPGSPSLIKVRDNGAKPEPGQRMIIPFWGSLFEAEITSTGASGTAHHTNVFLKGGLNTSINPRAQGGAFATVYYTDRVAYAVTGGRYTKDQDGAYTGADANGNAVTGGGQIVQYIVAPPGTPQGQRYRFENGELRFFKQRYVGSNLVWQDFGVVARNITSPRPFYVPLNAGKSFDSKYVGVRLSASDPKSSNRRFVATHSLLETEVDYRAAITLTQ